MPKSTNQKDLIVKTALKLFAKNGYATTPVSLIAKTAGVSQGLLYNFYKGKEDLLKDIMALGFSDIKASMAAYDQSGDPKELIARHVRKTIEIVEKNRALWKLLHALRLQEKVAAAMQKEFKQIVAGVANTFEQTFRQLGYAQPDLEALLFLAQIDGLVILYLQDNHTPIQLLGETLIKRFAK
jgi:AcrR family transcriptional regulator